ncbi:MAG: hypothetical protein LAP39_22320 [Acidobacteriia bacterium]|nr:hypothetical protein [Terriglobia bacterium]
MPDGKIQVTVGSVSFSGEGDPQWLAEQLDKVLKAAPEVAAVPPPSPNLPQETPPQRGTGSGGALVSHIRTKGGEGNQTKRFLATADWLRLRGETELTTAKVSKALSDNHQKRLGNPADCLNHNVRKGHCEKSGEGFFITPDGLRDLGHTS